MDLPSRSKTRPHLLFGERATVLAPRHFYFGQSVFALDSTTGESLCTSL